MRALVCVLILVTPPVGFSAEADPASSATKGIEHTLLHGLRLGRVRACCGAPEVPGLSDERVQSLAEARLREAGIEITPDALATLHVLTHVFVEDSCFATVRWALVEDARLERNGQLVRVQSWGGGGSTILATPVDQCAQQVTRAVERAVNDFAALYGAMNPKP